MPDFLPARSAYAGISAPVHAGTGVIVTDLDGLGAATVLTRKGQRAALAAKVRAAHGLDVPDGPRRVASGSVAFIGTGPDAWLATGEGGNAFTASLRAALSGVASVSDQSDGYALLRLEGPRMRDTLAKLIPIDLHPAAFPAGHAAGTLAGHIGVTVWRIDDGKDGGARFELAVFRSLAHSLWHALDESGAEFGVTFVGV